MEIELAKKKEMMTGRQILWHIFQHYRISSIEGGILEFEDLISVELRGDNLQAFVNEWELTLSGMADQPHDQMARVPLLRAYEQSTQRSQKEAVH